MRITSVYDFCTKRIFYVSPPQSAAQLSDSIWRKGIRVKFTKHHRRRQVLRKSISNQNVNLKSHLTKLVYTSIDSSMVRKEKSSLGSSSSLSFFPSSLFTPAKSMFKEALCHNHSQPTIERKMPGEEWVREWESAKRQHDNFLLTLFCRLYFPFVFALSHSDSFYRISNTPCTHNGR